MLTVLFCFLLSSQKFSEKLGGIFLIGAADTRLQQVWNQHLLMSLLSTYLLPDVSQMWYMKLDNSLSRVTTSVSMFFPRDLILFCSCLQGSPTLSSTSVFASNNPAWCHHELPTPKLSAPLQPTAVPYAQLCLHPLHNPPAPPSSPLYISRIETQVCVSTHLHLK